MTQSHDPQHSTPEAIQLYKLLIDAGVDAEIEHFDGHKHVDIAIPEAKLYIEVDGIQHLIDPEQILADLHRVYYSEKDGYGTFRIPNEIIHHYLKEVAHAIAEAAKKRIAMLHPTIHDTSPKK